MAASATALDLSFTGSTVVSVVVLLLAEARGWHAARAVSKSFASASFVALAVCRFAAASNASDAWLLAGLVLGAVGDVALLFSGDSGFLAGLGAFLLGHAAYAVAFGMLVPPAAWRGGAVAGVAVFGAVVLAWLWRRLGSMRVPVAIYVAVISVMLVGALSAWAAAVPRSERLALGAVIFALSDISVARDRFVSESFVNKAWGLPAYYVGQLCIAWSIES